MNNTMSILEMPKMELLLHPMPPIETLVRVDREVRPVTSYPFWMKNVEGVVHPEMELSGPPEYDLSEINQWAPKREEGVIQGTG